MDIQKFKEKREFLYHLTDKENFDIIKTNGKLLSTQAILELSNLASKEKDKILRERRPEHTIINIKGKQYHIRDQRPISLVNLEKCLTQGWSVGDFFQLLNSRVFFWPTTKRLSSHFKRYEIENPIIIKVSTAELLDINTNGEFCRLNSGATRSNSFLMGAPPKRGEDTFLPADQYQRSIGSVAEVTFLGSCQLPKKIFIGNNSKGPWEEFLF